jgi:hypothetical protein
MALPSWVEDEQKAFAAFQEQERLARIAAAAPDMLASLEEILASDIMTAFGNGIVGQRFAERARAAVAKARGEAK